jgi:hypothetical protein
MGKNSSMVAPGLNIPHRTGRAAFDRAQVKPTFPSRPQRIKLPAMLAIPSPLISPR